MPALASLPAIEVEEFGVHKALSVDAVRYDTFGQVSLTFDRRYRRSIQLTRTQLAAHIRNCTDVLNQLPEDR